MKAKLEFSLPEDQDEFTLATKGSLYYCCLFDIAEYIRSRIKNEESETKLIVLSEVQQEFFNILDSFNVNLEEVK